MSYIEPLQNHILQNQCFIWTCNWYDFVVEWMEFTPFEVGLLKYGAYIRAENYGSKFFMGRMMKKIPESQICFMKGAFKIFTWFFF